MPLTRSHFSWCCMSWLCAFNRHPGGMVPVDPEQPAGRNPPVPRSMVDQRIRSSRPMKVRMFRKAMFSALSDAMPLASSSKRTRS